MSENNHLITLSEAKELTHKFQQDPRFQGMTVASKISANAYSELLNQPGCAGIRSYFAIKEDAITIVVIGVDSNGCTSSKKLDINVWSNLQKNC